MVRKVRQKLRPLLFPASKKAAALEDIAPEKLAGCLNAEPGFVCRQNDHGMIGTHRSFERTIRKGVADIRMVGVEIDRGNEIEILGAAEIESDIAELRMKDDPEIVGQLFFIFFDVLPECPYVHGIDMETWSKKLQGIRKTECLTIRDHKPCFHPKTTPTSYTVTSCYHIEILQNYAAGIFPALGQGNAAIVLRQERHLHRGILRPPARPCINNAIDVLVNRIG